MLSVAGYLLLGDWQSIPYDPCTEYSPFHHPEIVWNETNNYYNSTAKFLNGSSHAQALPILTGFKLSLSSQIIINDKTFEFANKVSSLKMSCQPVTMATCQGMSESIVPLTLTINDFAPVLASGETLRCFHPHIPHTIICITIRTTPSQSTLQTSASIQMLRVLSNHSYSIARNQCITANITEHVCHWTPYSIVLKTECEDCPAICRSLHQMLTFPQFLLGLGLLLLSNSMLWVTLVALLFNQLPEELQVWA